MLDGNLIKKMFATLGFNIDYVMGRMSKAVNEDRLDEEAALFKKEAKKRFRARAKELHPDKEGEHEKMVELNEAYEFIKKMKFKHKPQPVVVRVFSFGYTASDATTSGTASVNVNYTTY